MVAIRELVTVRGGGTPRKSVPDYFGGDVPWVTPKDMKRWLIDSSEISLTEVGVAKSPAKHIPTGAVLVVVRSGVLKHTLPVAIAVRDVTVNQDMKALIPTDELESTYLARLLKARQPEILSWVRATTADNFPVEKLLDMRLHLPPRAEQRRISAILDQVDALRAARHRTLTLLDELTQSAFAAIFGDLQPGSTTVGDTAVIQGGLQVTRARATLPLIAPYLRVANVHRARLELGEIKTIGLAEAELIRTRLQTDDLLFVEGHANPLEVGRVAQWDGSVDNCTHQNHLIRARLDQTRCLPVYACHWLNSVRGAAHFRRSGKTTSGLNTISASTVRSAPLPLPPIDLQRTFGAQVDQIAAQRATEMRSLESLDALAASLLARAFSGELASPTS